MTTAGKILSEALARKKKKNASYSLRSLARNLSVSPAYLSQVINGKKRLSLLRSQQISRQLELTPQESAELTSPIKRLAKASTKYAKSFMDADCFQVISEWYHLPILDLISCRGFRP